MQIDTHDPSKDPSKYSVEVRMLGFKVKLANLLPFLCRLVFFEIVDINLLNPKLQKLWKLIKFRSLPLTYEEHLLLRCRIVLKDFSNSQ